MSLLERIRPLGGTVGGLLEASPGEAACDLDRDEVVSVFRETGALLFTGFAVNRQDFLQLTARFSEEFSTYQGGFFHDRQAVDAEPTLLTVTSSTEGFAIPLHGEMYYTQKPPGILWFCCETPSAERGETTVCDGRRIYADLSERARTLFESKRVKYIRHLPDGVWQSAFQTGAVEEVERYCHGQGMQVTFDPDDGSVTTELLRWALVEGPTGQRDTFINNIVALYLGELSFQRGIAARAVRNLSGGKAFQMKVRMENGAPVPGAVIRELLALNERHMADVRWRRGDVLMVDNTRVLHGRRAFEGPRDIFIRLAEPAF